VAGYARISLRVTEDILKSCSESEHCAGASVSQSLPGPLAIQVGIFAAYLRGGFWGAWAGGWAFILPNFLIVAALGALYIHFGQLSWMTAIFYGVSPAVIAIGDWLTVLIAGGSLIVLFKWKVSNPLLVGVTAVIGLIAFPLLQPQWVMVK
jgi:chromate transporter